MGRQSRAGIVAALIVIVLLALLWRRESRPQFDPNAVLTRVQQLNQLATVKYTIQKIVGLKDDKYPVGSESILLIMQANVEGGIDLSSMHERRCLGAAGWRRDPTVAGTPDSEYFDRRKRNQGLGPPKNLVDAMDSL